MYIFAYSIVMLTIGCGLFFGIRLAVNSFSARYVKVIYCPIYDENEAEYELRRLLTLYPNTLIKVPHAVSAAHRPPQLRVM